MLSRLDSTPRPLSTLENRFLGPAPPALVPRYLACLVLPTRSAMTRVPLLVCMSLPPIGRLPLLLLPRLLTVMMKFSFRPSALASSCTPSAPLYTDFLCPIADPPGFSDPPSGFPVAERTHRWLQMLAVTACFLHSMCPALSPSPFQPPSRTCSTPCNTDTATTFESLVGPPASVTSVLLGSPGMSPQPPPISRSFCCSPQVSGTPDQISDDEGCIPRLHGTLPPQPSAHASPPALADKVLIPLFSHRAVLVLYDGDAEASLPRTGGPCLSSYPSPPIGQPQPALQAGGHGRCPLGYGQF
jgi:hypothetical protein